MIETCCTGLRPTYPDHPVRVSSRQHPPETAKVIGDRNMMKRTAFPISHSSVNALFAEICLAAALMAPVVASAQETFVLVDQTFTADVNNTTDSHYKLDPNQDIPGNWTSPFDYRDSNLEAWIDVQSKPAGDTATRYTICFDNAGGVSTCLGVGPFNTTGQYTGTSQLKYLWNGGEGYYHWDQGVSAVQFVVKDGSDQKVQGNTQFYPTTIRLVLTVVPPDKTYTPPTAEPAETAGSGGETAAAGAGNAGSGGTDTGSAGESGSAGAAGTAEGSAAGAGDEDAGTAGEAGTEAGSGISENSEITGAAGADELASAGTYALAGSGGSFGSEGQDVTSYLKDKNSGCTVAGHTLGSHNGASAGAVALGCLSALSVWALRRKRNGRA